MKWILCVACLLAGPAWALGTDIYDDRIYQANETWLPGQDWIRYRALLYQESRLQPDALSPVGAEGIAQFMPGTWGDVTKAMGMGAVSPRSASLAIEAGAFYLAGRMRFWTEPRPLLETRRLGEACYNAGCGNILSAQRVCRASPCHGDCRYWSEIEVHLPQVTGRHADETRQYVERIEHWQRVMRVMR